MKKNKGITIVEILISVVVMGIVMVFLFSLLSQVKKNDHDNKEKSLNIMSQSTILKELQEDIASYGINTVSSCDIHEKNSAEYSLVNGEKSKCLKIEYADTYMKDNIAFLTLSKVYDEYDVVDGEYVGKEETATWKISYERGYYQEYLEDGNININSWTSIKTISKEIISNLNLVIDESNPYVTYTTSLDINAASIVMPIVTVDGEHFDINAGFTYSKENMIECIPGGNKTNGILTCSSDTSTDLFEVILNVSDNGKAYVNKHLVKWGKDAFITIIPDYMYKLDKLECSNGWKVEPYVVEDNSNAMQIKIYNNNSSSDTVCSISFTSVNDF